MPPLPDAEAPTNEGSPLLSAHAKHHISHLSMEAYELSPASYNVPKVKQPEDPDTPRPSKNANRWLVLILVAVMLISCAIKSGIIILKNNQSTPVAAKSIPRHDAEEHLLDIGDGLQIWFQTWGNVESGIPVMFVHGGPGQAIQDYTNNSRFFDQEEFFVGKISLADRSCADDFVTDTHD
jgi:hypothetical protein